MGSPGKLPSGAELYAMTMKGMTQKEIAELYGSTEHSVWRKLTAYRRGPSKIQRTHTDVIPWKGILKKHDNLFPAKMLRALGRRNHGDELDYITERELNLWLKSLDDQKVVIDYDRGKGWLKVPRLPEDEGGYIRRPPEEQSRS